MKTNIIQIGNPILYKKSKKVSIKNIKSKEIFELVENLIEIMRKSNLIGISACQIGKSIRIFVTEIRKTKIRNPRDISDLKIFINPEIIQTSKKEKICYEGCGSVFNTEMFAPIKRPEKIKIKAYGIDGKLFYLEADGLLSRVIQHEYDHLNGILFTQKISDTKKIMNSEEYKKQILKI